MRTIQQPQSGAAVPPARRPGRPRSDRAEEAILDAVLSLFGAGESYDSLSMEMIATAAGVGKATIYRRWPNKEALVIAAIGRRLHPEQPVPPPGRSARDDLICLLDIMRMHLQDDTLGSAYSVLTQLHQSNPAVSQRYHDQVIEPRRELFRDALRRGVATGQLRADLDVERAMIMLTGTMLAVARNHKVATLGPVDREFCVGLVDYLLEGVSKR
jgi:AcrR family transcriptional regulator